MNCFSSFVFQNRCMDTEKKEVFYVYILQSLKDFSFYIGQCDDLDRRMSKHFDGMSKYTASKRPLRLVYFEVCSTRSESIKRERKIKNMKSRIYLEQLIACWKIYPGSWRSPDINGRKCVYGNVSRVRIPSSLQIPL